MTEGFRGIEGLVTCCYCLGFVLVMLGAVLILDHYYTDGGNDAK